MVGINLSNANAEASAKDTVVSEGTNLGALAQQYFKKPTEMGGGGNSFVNFEIPSQLDSTISADWEIEGTPSATQIQFSGDPWEYEEWRVLVTVTSEGISTVVE